MVYISLSPSLKLTKTILSPSGDQVGCEPSGTSLSVNLSTSLPSSASIVNTAFSSPISSGGTSTSLSLINAILSPSGDQLGSLSRSLLSVNLSTSLPSSASITYIS